MVVFDKCHIIAHVRKALDETHRAEQRMASQADAEFLRGNRRVLLKITANLTPNQALQYQGLLKRNVATVKAHKPRFRS